MFSDVETIEMGFLGRNLLFQVLMGMGEYLLRKGL